MFSKEKRSNRNEVQGRGKKHPHNKSKKYIVPAIFILIEISISTNYNLVQRKTKATINDTQCYIIVLC